MNIFRTMPLLLLALCCSTYTSAQNIIEDGGVGLTRDELDYLVRHWTPDMQKAAANDAGDRLELLNMALASKKIAAEADKISPDDDPDMYWRQVISIRNIRRGYVLQHYLATLDVPDMSDLAKERYETQKDKYALVPEERMASHILLLCAPGACDREERRPEAQAILEELNAGANFEELAAERSEDPGSKGQGGKFDQWLQLGQAGVDAHFVGGVFSVEEVASYSDIVETRFGFHIIRLDDVRPEHYKPYEEVRDQLMADLRSQYVDLAAKEFDARFRISPDVIVDGEAMDEIFAPFKSGEDGQ